MKRLRALIAAAGASLLFACASQTPAGSSAASGSHDSAPETAVATPSATDTPPKDKPRVLHGYRRVVVDGQEKFCRNDPMTDSRVQSAVICLTQEEIENQHRGGE